MYFLFDRCVTHINIYDINIYDIPIQTQIEIIKIKLVDDPLLYLKLPSYLKNNKNITNLLVNQNKNIVNEITDYKDVIYFMNLHVHLNNKISYKLLNDKKEVLKIIKYRADYFHYLNDKLQNDIEIIEIVDRIFDNLHLVNYRFSRLFKSYEVNGRLIGYVNDSVINDKKTIYTDASPDLITYMLKVRIDVKLLSKDNIINNNVHDILYILINYDAFIEHIFNNLTDDMKKLFTY